MSAPTLRSMVATSLPMDLIDDDPGNVRTSIGDVSELRRSMATDGLLQPIIVYATGSGRYMAWAGHRRAKKVIYDRKNDQQVGRTDRGEARPATTGQTVSWFTRAHPLAATAAARCLDAGHSDLLRFGGSCGQCWEAEIRRDERLHTPASSAATDAERRMRCNRCEGDGSLRKQPCRAGGKTFAQHDYELIARPHEAPATVQEATAP